MAERVPNHLFHRWLMSAQRYEERWRKSNQQNFEYYDGRQWTDGEEGEIEERGQQPTVINIIQPTVDMVRSMEYDKRADIQVCGREDSDSGKAQLLTALLKQVFDVCDFDYYHSEAFQEALIGGRGWMECGVKTDETGKDVVYVEHIPWENVYLDPYSRKPDASDARFIFKVKWVDRDHAKRLFPAADELIDSVFDDDYLGQEHSAQMSGDRALGFYYDNRSQRVKICECYYTMPEYSEKEVLDERTGKTKTKKVAVNKVHYVIFSDELILQGNAEDHSANKSPLGIDYIPLVPVHCMRDHEGHPKGIVSGLVDIQDQINKLNSKFLWTIASNRLIAEQGAMRDPEEAREELQKPDGLVILNDGGLGKVMVSDKSRDLSYLRSHLEFLLQMSQRISGVNDSVLGIGGENERSGIMQSTRISQGTAMQASFLENMYFSKQRISLLLLRLIGHYYTDYRVVRITQANGTVDEYKFNWPQKDAATGKTTSVLNEIGETLAYDVILKKVPPFNTLRERQLLIFSEILKANVIPAPVAAKLVLQLSDMPGKEELIMELENFYKEQQAAAMQAPAAQ